MEEKVDMSDSYYPEKPTLKDKETGARVDRTVFSVILFILTFLWVFNASIWFILALVGVLFFHELGHFFFMKKFHYQNVKMLFIPLMGAFVQGKKEKYSERESFIVYLAGPMPGIIVGMVLYYFGIKEQNVLAFNLSLLLIGLNMMNLIPIDPLDGGQLFKLVFRKSQGKFQLAFALISSLFFIGVGFWVDSYLIIILGFLMSFRVRGIQKTLQIRKEMRDEGVDYQVSYEELSNRDYAKSREIVLDNNRSLKQFMELNDDPKVEQMLAREVQNNLIVPVSLDLSVLGRLISIFVWLSGFAAPIALYFLLEVDKTFIYDAIQSW